MDFLHFLNNVIVFAIHQLNSAARYTESEQPRRFVAGRGAGHLGF